MVYVLSLPGMCQPPALPPQSLGTREGMPALFLGASLIGKSAKHTVQGSTWKRHVCGMRAETRLMLSGLSTLHKLTKLSASQNAHMVVGSFWVALSDGILCLVSVL